MQKARHLDYDLTILGGGSGGLPAASLAASLGARTLLIEKERLGGECLYSGCVPSKSLLHVARLLRQAKQLQQFLQAPGRLDLDMPQVTAYIQQVIERIGEEEQHYVEGVTVRFGSAIFKSPTTLSLDGELITSRAFLIATGSHPAIPTGAEMEVSGALTNESIFDLTNLPSTLAIIGGGPVGVELGQAFARLGSQVTIIQRAERLLPREDPDVSEVIKTALEADGVQVHTSSQAIKARTSDPLKSLVFRHGDQDIALETEEVLLAMGRRPNMDALHLEAAGVAYNEQGIVVDACLRTSVPHIFAVGDVVGNYHFSHVAAAQAGVAVRNSLLPFAKQRFETRAIPWCTFTDPQAARVGLLPSEARLHHSLVRVVAFPYARIDRARTDQATGGFLKFVLAGKREEIVGAHLVGAQAGELLGELTLAVQQRLSLSTLLNTIHTYPTLSSGIQQLAFEAYLQGNQIIRHRQLIQSLLTSRRLLKGPGLPLFNRKKQG